MMRTDTEMEKRTALVLSILEGAAEENSTGMGGKMLEVELAATWERYQEEDRTRTVRTWDMGGKVLAVELAATWERYQEEDPTRTVRTWGARRWWWSLRRRWNGTRRKTEGARQAGWRQAG
jgi:hypothetical protein